MEASGASLERTRGDFTEAAFADSSDGVESAAADMRHFGCLLTEAVDSQPRIDQMTDRALVEKWPIERIDPTLRAIFRAAGAELLLSEVPPRVTISEFVDIAKAFFPVSREPAFVNAVLDHMARELFPPRPG